MGEVYPSPDLAARPASRAPISALPVDSRCTLGVLFLESRQTRNKEEGMIPTTLTIEEAQHLIELGEARLPGTGYLTTAQAVYYWNVKSQLYEREAVNRHTRPDDPLPPLPSEAQERVQRSRAVHPLAWMGSALL